jgi:hypothetical protein
MTIRLSAYQNSAVIPPVKAVRVRFVEKHIGQCCEHCHFDTFPKSTAPVNLPCTPSCRDDGRNGYWVAKKEK